MFYLLSIPSFFLYTYLFNYFSYVDLKKWTKIYSLFKYYKFIWFYLSMPKKKKSFSSFLLSILLDCGLIFQTPTPIGLDKISFFSVFCAGVNILCKHVQVCVCSGMFVDIVMGMDNTRSIIATNHREILNLPRLLVPLPWKGGTREPNKRVIGSSTLTYLAFHIGIKEWVCPDVKKNSFPRGGGFKILNLP